MQFPRGTFTFDGPAGRLEALYRPGREAVRGVPQRAAVVCHPLPTHGGTMHNKVVYRAAKALEGLGYGVLRFNFRGVGASGGTFSNGIGEGDDVRAALDWLAAAVPGAGLIVAGFSFGNAVGLPVGAVDPRVTHLVGLGTPTDRFPFDRLGAISKPKLFVQGDQDEHGPLDALRAGLKRVADPKALIVIPGADHFFAGRLPELEAAIRGYFSAPGDRSIASA